MTNTEFHAPLDTPITDPYRGDPSAPHPSPRRPRGRAILVLALAVAALVCSIVIAVLAFLGADSAVPAATVGAKLSQDFGAPISCSDDLPARVGATITCTGTDDQGVHHLLVTATAVDGSQVDFTGTVQD
jgi:hypothetical protein